MALGDFDRRWKNPPSSSPEQLYLWAQELIGELRRGEFLANAIGSGIPNSQLADMAAWTIKMRNAASAGDPADVTINGLTEEVALDGAADFVPVWHTSAGAMRKGRPANVGRSGGLQLLASGSVTNAATLAIVLTAYAAYRGLTLILANFTPATDAVALMLRLSTNGGTSYDAGASDYSWDFSGRGGGGAITATDVADSEIELSLASVGNGAAEGITSSITIMDQVNTGVWAKVKFACQWVTSDATPENAAADGGGVRRAAQDTDALEVRFSAGNIASGKWALYGLA